MKYEIRFTKKYEKIFKKLDRIKQAIIIERIDEIAFDGHFGDCKIIEKDLYELRIFACGGIRLYYTIDNNVIVLLLNIGGKESKSQQQKDIAMAR